MAFEALYKRKWWHGTLIIKDRISANVLSTVTTANVTSPAINAAADNVFAYSDVQDSNSCQVSIPTASFDVEKSGGFFVYNPSYLQIFNSFVPVFNYADVLDVNKRRIFRHEFTAAYDRYDAECQSTTPTAYDEGVYRSETKTDSSIAFVFPEISSYASSVCCGINAPSPNLPTLEIDHGSLLFFITRTPLGVNPYAYTYKIYSYNYANTGLSSAFNFYGRVEYFQYLGNQYSLYNLRSIGWHPSNYLYASTTNGFKKVVLGNSNRNLEFLKVTTTFENYDFDSNSNWSEKMRRELFYDEPQCLQYDTRDGVFKSLLNFKQMTGTTGSPPVPAQITTIPKIYKVRVENSRNFTLQDGYTTELRSFTIPPGYPRNQDDGWTSLRASDLIRFKPYNEYNYYNQNGAFGYIKALEYINNPDTNIGSKILIGMNSVGQFFTIDETTASLTNLPDTINEEVVSATSTRFANNPDLRTSKFPITFGYSHWLIAIQISSSMTTFVNEKIKPALLDFVNNNLRYNDKLTLVFFNNTNIRSTFVVKTYRDSANVTSYIQNNLICTGNQVSLLRVLNDIKNEYTDIKNLVLITDSGFTDINSSATRQNAIASLDAIFLANRAIVYNFIDMTDNNGNYDMQALSSLFQYGEQNFVRWK